MRRAIIWFRNDLRLHDNEALTDALSLADEVIPVYIFDSRSFQGKTKFGFPKTNKFRAKFIIESVLDLKQKLEALGSNLFVEYGITEEILAKKAREWKTHWVFCNRERTDEEVQVQDKLEQKLWVIGQEMKYYRGKMLYYTADLPFPVTHCPDFFSNFRKETENFVSIRKPLDTPSAVFSDLSIDIDWGSVPDLKEFGFDNFEITKGVALKGGETEALKELNYYLWETDLISNYKKTRNGLLGRDFSSKFSSYLSQGCLSPKLIYHEVKKYEEERSKNDSTYWLIFELLWRDFFRLMAKKHGNKIFKLGGIKDTDRVSTNIDFKKFETWSQGKTGIPFIDANMRELNETGFMSNRGRQNVASFLVNDLDLNWLMGAEYFESMLTDYDPCSNYGNWNYLAGVGSDMRDDRYFNIISQAKRYDPEGDFTKYWIPELQNLPSELIHAPDQMTSEDCKKYAFKPGVTYPKVSYPLKNSN